jgi:hypothetical protein
MRLMLAFAVVLLAASLTGQVEHAPTVAQCQADQRLWDYEFMHQSEKLPGVGVLQQWKSEMIACEKVDPQTQLQYLFTADEVDSEILLRMMHFLQRRNMLADFKTEDAAGKR